ncbi:MAG: VanZ family protein [Chloroflexi bacterium]|nr:VanZ family protein [Chloroflexota bacterium]
MKRFLLLLWRWGPAIAWMVVIFVVSSLSSHPGPRLRPYSTEDIIVSKSAHLAEYFILAILLIRSQKRDLAPVSRRGYLLSFVIATLFAATDEFHQSLVPGRTASAWDVLVDAVGAGIAIPLAGRSRRG